MRRAPSLPETGEIACWRLVPSTRPTWQGGLLGFDEELGGWSWDDSVTPDDAHPDTPKAYWTPPLCDAHTHLGDAFLRPERARLPRDLAALVAPPDGYKHRRLRDTDARTIGAAMKKRLHAMAGLGTGHALDFREGGADGLRLLLRAALDGPTTVSALVRPAHGTDDPDAWCDELDDLLDGPSAGVGLSALRDLPPRLAGHAADAAHARGKLVALHLSEATHEPMTDALALEPHILVHLIHARPAELAAAADHGALAVTCPTSNHFFGAAAPITALHAAAVDHGLATAFGTDNAMLGDSDLVAEIQHAATLAPEADLDWLLRSLTWTPWAHLGLGPDPAATGLIWGVHRKVPTTLPEDTALGGAAALFSTRPRLAPRL